MTTGTESRRDPAVTIVVAAFDAETCIARAIASIVEPPALSIEIVVVDDASRDGTLGVVEAIAAHDQRIRIERLLTNSGPSAARNRGIAVARGDWIAVLDADDVYLPGRLARLVALGEEAGADIVADNFIIMHPGELQAIPALALVPLRQRLDQHGFLAGARPDTGEADFGLLKPLFRTEFLRDHGLRYPETIRHGEDFELIVAALSHKAVYILNREDAFYCYTARTSGLSRTLVNYTRQIERCGELARTPPLQDDAVAVRLLRERAAALCRLNLNARSYAIGRSPVAPSVLWHAVRSEPGRAWLLERMKNRVRR